MRRTLAVVVAVAVGLLPLTACGASSEPGAAAAGRPRVVTGFYPLQFVAERVGADHVEVSNLTKPGTEPHDLELTPREVRSIAEADLVLYLEGFQPAVDEAVEREAADRAMDASEFARLDLDSVEDPPANKEQPGEDGAGDHQAVDPHFWLDPTRLADVADAVAKRYSELAPDRAAEFQANAAALRVDLRGLDEAFAAALRSCTSRNLVVSHAAFGYLAQRYDLTQVPISGLSPDDEPSSATLGKISRFVQDNNVRTIYYETLVSPDVAKTVAAEAGTQTAVLDPVEGITDESAGKDYIAVMKANLATLTQSQPCP